ncbi:hypothetical protein D9613_012026 [Agrocybe pediades]|uniref:Uncharacterized protein n=1 Tax=Agrocybe pediades TaxID=84607 RepID=A0A8H4QEW1_9AGAR|nr:hypothetical protein D9613_012026 [Agrocybe pediades]
MILESATDTEKVLHVLSLHMMNSGQELVCCAIIEKLLLLDEGELETLFCDLGALVQIRWVQDKSPDSEPHQYLHILHASLFDYLLDKERSKQFFVDRNHEDIKHLTRILQYLASYGYSFFNENVELHLPLLYIFSLNILVFRWETISLELRQVAFSFPLKQFLEPHSQTELYCDLVESFVSPFLGLLEIIVLKDPQWSYIRDHQHGILVSMLNHELQHYNNHAGFAWLLLTFYHLGSHRFVPIINPLESRLEVEYSIPPGIVYDPSGSFMTADTLSLRLIWDETERRMGSRHPSGSLLLCRYNFFHDFVHRLLRDPSKSAVNPSTYEKAALFCFEWLSTISLPVVPAEEEDVGIIAMEGDADDDDPCLDLALRDDGQWMISLGKDRPTSRLNYECFVLLGYVAFLLHHCVSKSDALILACEEYKASIAKRGYGGAFPIRRRLLLEEINKYLARSLTTDV